MGIFRQYAAYLKDNPEGYWFKRKLFGWGWVPVRWQGWVIVGVYIAALVYISTYVDGNSHSVSDTLYGVFVPFVVMTILLIVICYKKGEKPKWMWGVPKKDDQ